MSARPPREEQSIPEQPQTPPPFGSVTANPDFVLHSIVQMEKSIAGMKSSVEHLERAVERLTDKADDLMAFKNKLLGIAAAIALATGFLTAVAVKGLDYFLPKAPPTIVVTPVPVAPAPAASR